MRYRVLSALIGIILTLCSFGFAAAGKIVVVNDDWVLSNTGFAAPNDPGTLATNVAAWFTGGQPGKFHAYSDHFGLTGSSLASAITGAGHTWTTGTAGFTFDLATLQGYDGIFLLVAPADNNVLIDYVESGGNVYLAYSGDGSGLDEQYDTFVNHFGLALGVINNGIVGNVAISSPHPIFVGVDSLYNVNGSDIVDLVPADPRQTILVSQNGHNLYAVYDESTSFTQSDLIGTWYFQVSGDSTLANGPFWVSGTTIIDATGAVVGGTCVNDSGVVRTITGGSFTIDATGQTSGSLTLSSGTVESFPHGKLDAGKKILTMVNSETNGRALFVAEKGGGTFTQSDLIGTWYFQVSGDSTLANGPFWVSGTTIIDATGAVVGGTCVNDSGVVRTITGGSFTIDATGQTSGSLTLSSGTVESFPYGKLDAGKKILTMVNSETNGRALFVAEKGGGTFTQPDLTGTWHIQVFEDNTLANSPYWASGTLIIDASGNVTGGSAINDSGLVRTFTGGSLILDSTGQISGTLAASGGVTGTLPHGKLNVNKNILIMVSSDSTYRGLFVAIKSTANGPPLYATFTGAGLYQYNGSTWTQLTPYEPTAMTATGSLLYASFGNGVWQYSGSTWSQLTPYSPEAMVASGSLLYGKYSNGIWQYNGSTWSQLTPYSPIDMITSGSLLNGKYDNGIWQYNGSTWTQLTPYSPAAMVAGGSLLYGKYDNGIWQYSGSTWTQLTPYSPATMVAAGSLLYGKYDNGIWQYNGSTWTQLTPSNPEAMVASGSLLYGDFGSTGIWMYNGSTWTQITPNDPASMTGN